MALNDRMSDNENAAGNKHFYQNVQLLNEHPKFFCHVHVKIEGVATVTLTMRSIDSKGGDGQSEGGGGDP